MNEKLSLALKNISLACLSIAFILTPLFFLPITTDFFQLNKQILFTFLTAAALISWLFYNWTQKSIKITVSPLLLPLLSLAAVTIISVLLNSPKNPEAWLTRPALMVVMFVYFLLTTTLLSNSQAVRKVLHWLMITGLIVAVATILSVMGVTETLKLPAFLTSRAFNFTGSALNLIAFFTSLLPISLILAFKVKSGPRKLLYFLTSGVIISSLILIGYQMLPGKNLSPLLLPKLTGWSIAADTLKTKALFGSGPNDFLNQFTQFKPISLNRTNLWTVNFSASANEYFHILTTLGLAGLIAFLWLITAWYKLVKRDPGTRTTATQTALNCAVAIMFILALFIPLTAFSWIILAGYLSLSVALNKTKNLTKVKDIMTPVSFSAFPLIIGIPVLAGVLFSGYLTARAYLSEAYFQQSLLAADQNNGTATYNLQIKSIGLSPLVDRYHVVYSNTNLALANSLATKPELTDQDRQTITQLIQQSIREARSAVEINPKKASNWQNLANVYRSLINFAQGADEFATSAYTQAVQLDPANPALRLELGGMLYSLTKYDDAILNFQAAIQLKPDFANAYYNLSHSFDMQKKYLEAYQVMQQVEALLPADSADAVTVKTELADLKLKLPQEATQPQAASSQPKQLSEPSPAPEAPKDFAPVEVAPTP